LAEDGKLTEGFRHGRSRRKLPIAYRNSVVLAKLMFMVRKVLEAFPKFTETTA
jgi:hypothetical protein